MIPDCIEPVAGGLLREIMNKSVSENVADCWNEYDFGALWEARLHWSGCPACRTELRGVPAHFAQIGVGLENRCRKNLSCLMDEFLGQKNRLLAAAADSPSAYPEIIARLAVAEDDVIPSLAHGQEVLSLRVSAASPEEPEAPLRILERAWEQPLSSCQEFIRSLGPGVQCFVHAVTHSRSLLTPFCRSMDSECEETGGLSSDELQQRMQAEIESSLLDPATLFWLIELASAAYGIYLKDWSKGTGVPTVGQTDLPPGTLKTQEPKALQVVLQEWKRDFDSLEDSLKAGQTELVRLIERNSRSAAEYEPYIVAQLGTPLYSRLHETTRRAIRVSEYLYHINQEPDGFSLTAIRMAQGYENELTLRVIWPFVNELLASGTQTYDAQGMSKEPLIRSGRVRQRGMTLGSLAWYLGKDPVMRSKVSRLGFDVGAISKDAAWVSEVRNNAAHDFACDRAPADDLRRRILCRDGILSRLHPMVATTAAN